VASRGAVLSVRDARDGEEGGGGGGSNVEALLRSSEALAQLLEAGCGPVAELLGRRLMALE
jgi:hypothetical protein